MQFWLDNVASAYLVEYNIDDEYQYHQDLKLDKQYSDMYNQLLEKIFGLQCTNNSYKDG